MPLVQISLLRGKPMEYIRAIADGVHNALVATFNVPLKDRFQVVQQLAPEEFFFDPDYLDVQRTADIVVIHIVASRTRSTAMKQAFYKATVENLTRHPGLRAQDVQIILSPNEREDWSFGNGVASYLPPAETATNDLAKQA